MLPSPALPAAAAPPPAAAAPPQADEQPQPAVAAARQDSGAVAELDRRSAELDRKAAELEAARREAASAREAVAHEVAIMRRQLDTAQAAAAEAEKVGGAGLICGIRAVVCWGWASIGAQLFAAPYGMSGTVELSLRLRPGEAAHINRAAHSHAAEEAHAALKAELPDQIAAVQPFPPPSFLSLRVLFPLPGRLRRRRVRLLRRSRPSRCGWRWSLRRRARSW